VEKRQLADRAEPVLGGAHVTKAAGGVALEIEHGIHEMLEHARTCDRAVLGHVADDDHAHARALGETHELRGAFLQLRDGARGRADRLQLDGLDGIDDEQFDAFVTGPGHDRFEVGVGDDAQVRA
jgi:hypothetical protein